MEKIIIPGLQYIESQQAPVPSKYHLHRLHKPEIGGKKKTDVIFFLLRCHLYTQRSLGHGTRAKCTTKSLMQAEI